jgi:hypothetical protein
MLSQQYRSHMNRIITTISSSARKERQRQNNASTTTNFLLSFFASAIHGYSSSSYYTKTAHLRYLLGNQTHKQAHYWHRQIKTNALRLQISLASTLICY